MTWSCVQVLMDNIKRVSNLVRTVLATVEFINSTWSWENKPLSATAFVVRMREGRFCMCQWLYQLHTREVG